MKKSISFILTIALILSMFACLGVVASAADPTVTSVTYTAVNPTIYENSMGYWDQDAYGNWYYYYDYAPINEGDAVTLYYSNGAVETYYFSEYYGNYYDVNGTSIPYNWGFWAIQYSDHWYLGETCTIEFRCGGASTNVYATIVPSPVSSIAYYTSLPLVYREGEDCYTTKDSNEVSYYDYYLPYIVDGDILAVAYTNGSYEEYVYVASEGWFYSTTTGYALSDADYFRFTDDQYVNHWYVGAGGNNYYNVEYCGKQVTMYTTVIPSWQALPRTLVYLPFYGFWACYEGHERDYDYTGLVEYNGGWYYVEYGEVDWSYTGLVEYYGCWYYVRGGVIDWGYTGLVEYGGCWYFVNGGAIDWNYTGLVSLYGDWYYVRGGVIDWGYTGLVEYGGCWYYVTNGYLNWNTTTLTYYGGCWYYVENGSINWNSNTLVNYGGCWYYARNGVVAWDYTGYVYYQGYNYWITNGCL